MDSDVEPRDIRFSVVIPAYNESNYLGRTLDSLHDQDFAGRVEIIVVDNASTDDTAAIAADRRVRVLHEPRQGVCWARQRGTQAACGEIVISTDADTVFPRSWLSSIDASFRARGDCVAVAGPCRFEPPPVWGALYSRTLFGVVRGIQRASGRVVYATATNLAFRRSAFPGYNTQLTQGGDEFDLLRRLRERGPVVFDPANVVRTSARRLSRGLIRSVFVSLLWFYVLGYWLNRFAPRTLVGMEPAVRLAGRARPRLLRLPRVAIGALAVALAAVMVLAVSTDLRQDTEAGMHRLQATVSRAPGMGWTAS